MIRVGDIKQTFTILTITAAKPRLVPFPAEKKASTPANPAKNAPTIGIKILAIAITNAAIPNDFKLHLLY